MPRKTALPRCRVCPCSITSKPYCDSNTAKPARVDARAGFMTGHPVLRWSAWVLRRIQARCGQRQRRPPQLGVAARPLRRAGQPPDGRPLCASPRAIGPVSRQRPHVQRIVQRLPHQRRQQRRASVCRHSRPGAASGWPVRPRSPNIGRHGQGRVVGSFAASGQAERLAPTRANAHECARKPAHRPPAPPACRPGCLCARSGSAKVITGWALAHCAPLRRQRGQHGAIQCAAGVPPPPRQPASFAAARRAAISAILPSGVAIR